MGFNFNNRRIKEFIDDIRNFKTNLVQFDVERVKMNAAKRFAVEMTEMVIQTLKAHPDINAPAETGPYESGPGPSIASKRAWIVDNVGGRYAVRPHPEVRQRAVVLNDGYGRIEPDGDGPLRFYVNGFPIFAEYVDGPEETQYWQSAYTRLIQSGKIEEIAEDELQKEAERVFNNTTKVID